MRNRVASLIPRPPHFLFFSFINQRTTTTTTTMVDLDTCPLSESGVGMLTIDTGDPLPSPLPLPPPLARTLASFLLTQLLLDLEKIRYIAQMAREREGRRREMEEGGIKS